MFGFAPLPRTLPAALRDLGSPKLPVRLSALRDLVRHARNGEASAEQAIVSALLDAVEDVRAEAALGLADADRPGHAAELARLAQHDASLRVRQMALLALGELAEPGSPEAHAAIVHAYRAGDAAERFQALLALHQLGAPETEKAVLEGMVDPDAEIRRLSFRIAEAHWAESGALPEIARARARGALSEQQPAVRTAAALLLAHFGDMSGKEVVVALVEHRMPGASVEDEQAAIAIAAQHMLGEVAPALERRAFSFWIRDPLAYDARIALARLGNARARAALLDGLDAWSHHARTLAVVAVGRARLDEARARLQALADRPERADPVAVRDALVELDRPRSE